MRAIRWLIMLISFNNFVGCASDTRSRFGKTKRLQIRMRQAPFGPRGASFCRRAFGCKTSAEAKVSCDAICNLDVRARFFSTLSTVLLSVEVAGLPGNLPCEVQPSLGASFA